MGSLRPCRRQVNNSVTVVPKLAKRFGNEITWETRWNAARE
jgi:hypothetical protein